MPIYEYECIPNRHKFEVMQKMADEPLSKCVECGGPVRKLVSAPGFQFKGGGWYKDGYTSVNKSSAPAETSAPATETKKAETPVKKETAATSTPTKKES